MTYGVASIQYTKINRNKCIYFNRYEISKPIVYLLPKKRYLKYISCLCDDAIVANFRSFTFYIKIKIQNHLEYNFGKQMNKKSAR